MDSSIRDRCYCFLLFVVLAGCRHQDRQSSFYYWKTTFSPDSAEQQTLAYNHVKKLYIRYFDVDLPSSDSLPSPVSPINFQSPVTGQQVIPVVFLRNRVFERVDSAAIDLLAEKVQHLVAAISETQHLHTSEIQFDCDWTERTKDSYFLFLKHYRYLSGQTVTCTIRLHQVKYPNRTGIPPVTHGVLMYYNMGDIDAGSGNSIYDPAIAARYIYSLHDYPLSLDIALPIFSWGMQIRDGHVLKLLNKMNFLHFQNDPNFTRVDSNRYRAAAACFDGGYYFREGDIVKIEHIPAEELTRIAENIQHHSNHRLGDLIFFDLDKTNLVLYDKDVFKEILDHFD